MPKQVMTRYPIKRKKRKDMPKTAWIDGICGMTVEMGLTKDDWRNRENW